MRRRPEIGQQLLATGGGAEESDIGNPGGRERAQVGQIGRQVMAHDDGGGESGQVERRGQRIGARQKHSLGGREVRGDRVRRSVVDQRHFPVEAGGEIHHRHRVGSGPEQQDPRRQGKRHDEELPRRVLAIHPGDPALTDRALERRPHGRRFEPRVPCPVPPGTVGGQRQGSDRKVRARRLDHHAERGRHMLLERAGEMGKRLPVVVRARPEQQDLHCALAPESQSPQRVIPLPEVVLHRAGLAGADHGARVLAQIGLETAAGEQPGVFAVGGDQHEGPRLAIGRAGGMHEHADRQRPAGGALTPEQGQ